jgi:hypothetical protein
MPYTTTCQSPALPAIRFLAGGLLTLAMLAASTAPAAAAQKPGPVQVYIMAGQSNMDGQAGKHTIDFIGEDEDKDRAALLKVFKPDGTTYMTRDDVWCSSGGAHGVLQTGFGGRKNYDKLGDKIGPEYAFGQFMAEASPRQIYLIKYAPGGQSLYQNFRPPSAGVPEGGKPEDYGNQYRGMIASTRENLANLKQNFPGYDEKAGYEVAGFVWFQGFNDQFVSEEQRKEYGKNLVHLINDVRKEFQKPNLPVVVGVMGVNGVRNEAGKQKDIRDGHRYVNTVPEFKGTVKAVETAPLLHPKVVELRCAGWLYPERDLAKQPLTEDEQALLRRATSDKGFHYNGEGRFFILLGKLFADTMLDLQKGQKQ